tara:strand:- start:94 stop:639 length:546 start_codon:yes stop_codon:yes gene_type:complete
MWYVAFQKNTKFVRKANFQLEALIEKARKDIEWYYRAKPCTQNHPMVREIYSLANQNIREAEAELKARKENQAKSKDWTTKWLDFGLGEDEADHHYTCFRPLPCGTKVRFWRSHAIKVEDRDYNGFIDNYEGWYDEENGREPQDFSRILPIAEARELWKRMVAEINPYTKTTVHTPIWKLQ